MLAGGAPPCAPLLRFAAASVRNLDTTTGGMRRCWAGFPATLFLPFCEFGLFYGRYHGGYALKGRRGDLLNM